MVFSIIVRISFDVIMLFMVSIMASGQSCGVSLIVFAS